MYFKTRRGTSGVTSASPLRCGTKDRHTGKYIYEGILLGAFCVCRVTHVELVPEKAPFISMYVHCLS
jgi:hypothetical protein